MALTCGCLILFNIMLFVCAWVLTELLPHPVYAWKQMSPLSILGEKKLSLQYCLKLSIVTTTTLHMLPFSILNFTLYLKENPLNYLLSQCVFQVICKLLVSKRVMSLHLLYHRPAVNFTLHGSDKSNTPPEIFKHRFYELCHEFMNSVTSLRIIIAYLLMALKKVTELLHCCCPPRQH